MQESNLNLFTSHNLIPRNQNYVIDRKLVSIHSNDRDIRKWPFANNFEIELPQTLYNISTINLVTSNIPIIFYTFNYQYQNLKLSFNVLPCENDDLRCSKLTTSLEKNSKQSFTIEIREGSYSPENICLEIENKMNKEVEKFLKNVDETAKYDNFKLKYDSVGKKIIFGNNFDNFLLNFNKKEIYNIESYCNQIEIWNKMDNWGLPYYLGFEKNIYKALKNDKELKLDYEENSWLKSMDSDCYVIESPFSNFVDGENVIYMEIEKFNSMDEIEPFSESTNTTYNNDYNGRVNGSFEKIPISTKEDNDQTLQDWGSNLRNITWNNPPIETIRKLKFKFRFHDGRLVDFQNKNFNFTLAFNCVKNEIPRKTTEVNVPSGWRSGIY